MSRPVSDYDDRQRFVSNPSVEKILSSSFNSKYGGIHVIVAPSGSGKTTYLRSYANRFIKGGGYVQYFGGELASKKQFFASFGDEKRAGDLFEVIPKPSVIVLDQIEHFGSLNDEIKSLLKHLAFESTRISGVGVIVSTSSPRLASEILRLNGNDKIRTNGNVSAWRWTHEMIDDYMAKATFRDLKKEVTNAIKELAYMASCPAFLCSCAELALDDVSQSSILVLSEMAKELGKIWDEFENIDFMA